VIDVPKITLNDGNTIPQLGIGVFQVPPEQTADVVLKALEVGYRHIDTAEMYRNEQQVGDAVKQSGIDRADIFITSKLNNDFHEPDEARQAFAETLNKLSVEYIDLFLIHWPLPGRYGGDFVSTWRTLEEFKRDGRAKSIGVSNFQVPHLERLAKETETVPAVNQIELHPYFPNQTVAAYDADHGIATEAWSPIARGDVLDDPMVTALADDTGKTPAQVVLRWHIQKGYIVFPKSSTPERIEENFALFDFELNDEQMKRLDGLGKGESGRRGPNPDTNNG
jgi:2,5-diketo-D-gluconate reductase A